MNDILTAGDVPLIFVTPAWLGTSLSVRVSEHWGRGLRRQALLADGAGGEDQGGPAQAGGVRAVRTATCWDCPLNNRLWRTPGDARRPPAPADSHRVPAARRATRRMDGTGVDLRASAATGLGPGQDQQRRSAHADHREAGCAASWATTRTTPPTSSPSLASATGCRRGRR